MNNEELLDELRKEIRELKEEVRQTRGVQFIPQPYPVYVPHYPQPCFQPYVPPYWTTTTVPVITWTNAAAANPPAIPSIIGGLNAAAACAPQFVGYIQTVVA
jgi:hypothetical protein